MSSRRRLSLLLVAVGLVALIAYSYREPAGSSPADAPVAAAGAPRAALDGRSSAPPTASTTPGAPQPTSAVSPTASLSPDAALSPSPAAEETSSPQTPHVVPLAQQAAQEYRHLAQYPPWSHPFGEEGEDPILRDREVTMVTATGPEGEQPTLTVFPDQVGFEAPDPILLYAFLSVHGDRIPAEEVTGQIMDEDLKPQVDITYRDDGAGGDKSAGDLIYTARFTPGPDFAPDLSSSFLVRVRAVTADQQERIAATGFLYSNPHAQLTGRYRDSIVDGSLAVDAEVEVFRAGRFHLEATLYSDDGNRGIAEAQTAAELPSGTHWMRLSFFGRILNQGGVDGPYLLRFVALSTTTQMPNAKNRLVENAYRTRPYRTSDFSDAPFDDPDLLDAAGRLEGGQGSSP